MIKNWFEFLYARLVIIHRGVDDHHDEAEINHGRVGCGSRQMSHLWRCKLVRRGESIVGTVNRANGRVNLIMFDVVGRRFAHVPVEHLGTDER